MTVLGRSFQWVLADTGLGPTTMPLEHSLCRILVHERGGCAVVDARTDPELASSPVVQRHGGIRAYAGVPFRVQHPDDGGDIDGTFCVADDTPREFTGWELDQLRNLTAVASALLSARMTSALAERSQARLNELIRKLQRQETVFSQAEHMVDMGNWRYDLADERVEWSKGVFAIHGLPVSATPPLDTAMKHYLPESRARLSAALEEAVANGAPFDLELDFETSSGARKRVRTLGDAERVDGRVVALIGVFQDITARHDLEQALRLRAVTDPLTGLPNRAGFHQTLNQILASEPASDALELLLVDLDDFKRINDEDGHIVGDRALQAVARALRLTVEPDGYVARYGGDEFVILLSGPGAADRARRVRAGIVHHLAQSIVYDPGQGVIRATVGSATHRPGETSAELVHRADLAMYEAKLAETTAAG